MCGIAGAFGRGWERWQLEAIVGMQRHRGPDDEGVYVAPGGVAGLGHNRLSILDLSAAGRQPMRGRGPQRIVFNGEIYNYAELRGELSGYPYASRTDTEVALAAFERWGEGALDRFVGMFALLLWDEREQRLLAARDRFGVKPLLYHQRADGTLLVASEIAALHAAGVPRRPDAVTWATYLATGLHDHTGRTFWEGISALPPGHLLRWHDGRVETSCWYDVADRVGPDWDERPERVVRDELLALLQESVRLRFRSDVPVGINLSGGLDSSVLLGLVHATRGHDDAVTAFTFVTGDPAYDELPWVERMLARTRHRSVRCLLTPADVPALAASVHERQLEPFGGLPTLAYARLFERARAEGVTVLLDGQGVDEGWAGYDYYRAPAAGADGAGGADGASAHAAGRDATLVQGTTRLPVRPDCLTPELRALAEPFAVPRPFPDRLRNLQYRDICFSKLPRVLRYNDRVSMRASTELREPFLDHRLIELALRQPDHRKIADGTGKWLPRQVVRDLLPDGIVEAPKRPLQTPQREWLRGALRPWATACIERALDATAGDWLDAAAVRRAWSAYAAGEGDNSVFVWQWISLGLLHQERGHEHSPFVERQECLA